MRPTFKTTLIELLIGLKLMVVEVSSTTNAKEDYILPSEFRLGITINQEYYFLFNLEGEYVRFSEIETNMMM